MCVYLWRGGDSYINVPSFRAKAKVVLRPPSLPPSLTGGVACTPLLEHLGQRGDQGVVQLDVRTGRVVAKVVDQRGLFVELAALNVTRLLNWQHPQRTRDADGTLGGVQYNIQPAA